MRPSLLKRAGPAAEPPPAPHTYAEWAAVLERLQSGTADEDVLQQMENGAIEWQAGVAERFSRKLIEAVNSRMNAATDKFQRDIARAQGREGAVVQALLALRRELALLCRAMGIPALPPEQRRQYVQLVRDQADRIQASLEDSARKDRSGKLASIVRNHRVNGF